MSGTVKIRTAFTYTKGNVTISKEWEHEESFDTTDDKDVERHVFSPPTSGSNLPNNALGGIIACRNHDSTNFHQLWANLSEDPLVQLKPGEVCLLRVDEDASSDIVKSDTSAALFEIVSFPPRPS